MSANYHTPLSFNAGADTVAFNAIFGTLDQGITDVAARATALEAIFAGTDGYDLLSFGAGSELTIASRAITIAGSRHTVDTEGEAATDYLDTITASSGQAGILILENAARVITIRNLVGNIRLYPALDYTWDSTAVALTWFYDGTYVHVWTGSTQAEAVALLADEKAQNTAGGDSTSGAWRTRDVNTKRHDANVICSITKLAFTSGGTAEIAVGDEIEGATGGATATVFDVELTGGSWAAGTAAGNLWLNDQAGAFVVENLDTATQANIATVAADSTDSEIRLKAGTYRFDGSCPIFDSGVHQTRVQNTTDATTAVTGTSEFCSTADTIQTRSFMRGRTTITAAKTFEIQYQTGGDNAGDGLGYQANFTTEVYTLMEITKEL